MKNLSRHWLVDFFNCDSQLINSVDYLENTLAEAARIGHLQVLHRASHSFHPQGVTAFLLLAESHISVHSWPEHGFLAFDLFSCSPKTKIEPIVEYVQKQIGSQGTQIHLHDRGCVLRHDPMHASHQQMCARDAKPTPETAI